MPLIAWLILGALGWAYRDKFKTVFPQAFTPGAPTPVPAPVLRTPDQLPVVMAAPSTLPYLPSPATPEPATLPTLPGAAQENLDMRIEFPLPATTEIMPPWVFATDPECEYLRSAAHIEELKKSWKPPVATVKCAPGTKCAQPAMQSPNFTGMAEQEYMVCAAKKQKECREKGGDPICGSAISPDGKCYCVTPAFPSFHARPEYQALVKRCWEVHGADKAYRPATPDRNIGDREISDLMRKPWDLRSKAIGRGPGYRHGKSVLFYCPTPSSPVK